ncbi:MAG: response regulator transcription factor [Bacteroidia bacterium]
MIKVAIVDDKYINRVDRKLELEHSKKVNVVFTAQNGVEFLDTIKTFRANELPEIVLMDIDMPEKNGIETVREAKTIYPQIEFLMLTVFDEYDKIFEAIKAGASGYLLKDENTDTIINYIEQVKQFQTVPMSPSVARKALKLLSAEYNKDKKQESSNFNLTPREIEVLKGLVTGFDYKEIANSLLISPNTVRNQITSIYQKLHVTSKVDAVKIALKNDIV